MFKRIIAISICFCLVFEQAGFAQFVPQPVVPAYLSGLSPAADRYRPIHIRSINFDKAANNYQLILDKGDSKNPTRDQIDAAGKELFEYFKIGLALPN
ncbi:MAG: hypothetical protein WC547_10390, partial [Candidatus Omnitrophota bacterium]